MRTRTANLRLWTKWRGVFTLALSVFGRVRCSSGTRWIHSSTNSPNQIQNGGSGGVRFRNPNIDSVVHWPIVLRPHENLPILPESNRRCTFSLSVQTWPLMSMNRTLKSLRELPCTADIARSPDRAIPSTQTGALENSRQSFCACPLPRRLVKCSIGRTRTYSCLRHGLHITFGDLDFVFNRSGCPV